jgi:hypothetical protein
MEEGRGAASLVAGLVRENTQLARNLGDTQRRCTELLLEKRSEATVADRYRSVLRLFLMEWGAGPELASELVEGVARGDVGTDGIRQAIYEANYTNHGELDDRF